MATRKAISLKTAPILPAQGSSAARSQRDLLDKLADGIEVMSLTADNSLNSGGDPYNSTGQYVVLDAEKTK